jgi:hypothetical protein
MIRRASRYVWSVACAAALSLPCGCASRSAVARMMAPVLQDVARSVEEEPDLEMVRQAMPGNLLLLRGLLKGSPTNRELLLLASKTCYGYALAFLEEDEPERAIRLYREGREYAARTLDDFFSGRDPITIDLTDLESMLVRADQQQAPALFWLASNWGSWIRLEAGRPRVLAQLPKVVAVMDRVLTLDEPYFHGGPHLLLGVYHGSRSPALGGRPDLAAQHLQRAIEISHGQFLLPFVYRARYVHLPRGDRESFARDLREVLSFPAESAPSLRFFNELAKRKAEQLQAKMNELFEPLELGGTG